MTALAPPRYPRALFIAAFAVAGAATIRIRPGAVARDTPPRIEKRDRAIAGIVRNFGRSIIAAMREPQEPKATAPAINPILAAIMASDGVAGAIGRPSLTRDPDAAWIELNEKGAKTFVSIYWRGEGISGDKMVRVLESTEAGLATRRANGQTVGYARTCDLDRLSDALAHAVEAVRSAGMTPLSFRDVRKLRISALGGEDSFKGAVATFSMLTPKPPAPALVRGR